MSPYAHSVPFIARAEESASAASIAVNGLTTRADMGLYCEALYDHEGNRQKRV